MKILGLVLVFGLPLGVALFLGRREKGSTRCWMGCHGCGRCQK